MYGVWYGVWGMVEYGVSTVVDLVLSDFKYPAINTHCQFLCKYITVN